MCGLYGSIGFTPDEARLDLVAHRGPDGRGWRVFDSGAGPAALGHRRLAIIDMSQAAAQPMDDPTGRYTLVYNGEIYNYVELRESLRAQGEIFTTQSDSEVLLRAYAVWGEACLPKLRGMFAFLIWDAREQCLFAARDRFGIKPLYVVETAQGLAFASEIKQLLGLPGVEARMNLARVRDFLADGVSDHLDETMFCGVRQLRGGESARVEAGRGPARLTVARWHTPAAPALDIGEREAAERFRTLLTDATRLHLRSDVPVGSCLSGGLDSSSIVCLMSAMLPQGARARTVSACYADKSVDERPFMEAAVVASGARATYIFPRPEDVFARARDIVWHQDEPFGSTSIFAQWCVFEAARAQGVKVMLDGQGADEQLAGYHSGFPYALASLARAGRPVAAARLMAERRRFHGAGIGGQIARLVNLAAPPALARPLRRLYAASRHGWMDSPALAARGDETTALETAARGLGLPAPRTLRDLCVVMTYASNLPMLLHWEDRNSMAHSIEARVPFLDNPLVDFSLGLPDALKMAGVETKRVLREAMRGVLPETVRARRDKLGFATPEQGWFRGPLRGLVHDGVEATLARYPDLLDAKGARALRDDMLEGRKAVDFALWRIVSLGQWGERFDVSM